MKTPVKFVFILAVAALACHVHADDANPRITGTVRDAFGVPAAGVSVTFHPGLNFDGAYYSAVRTDANGRYEIVVQTRKSGIFWGHLNLTNSIMARDFSRDLATVQEFVGIRTNIDLILQPAITLTGSVKDTNGAPIKDAVAVLRFLSGDELAPLDAVTVPPFFPGNELGHAKPRPMQVDEFGSFWIPALPQGREYHIWDVSAKGYSSVSRPVRAKDTQTNRYEFPTIVLKPAEPKLADRRPNR